MKWLKYIFIILFTITIVFIFNKEYHLNSIIKIQNSLIHNTIYRIVSAACAIEKHNMLEGSKCIEINKLVCSKYLQASYPFKDAWGRIIKLTVNDKINTIQSSGQDGIFNTNDDIILDFNTMKFTKNSLYKNYSAKKYDPRLEKFID